MDEQHPLDFVVLVTQTQFAAEIHTRSARRRTKNTPSVSVHEIASRRLELGMSQAELAAAINVKAKLDPRRRAAANADVELAGKENPGVFASTGYSGLID